MTTPYTALAVASGGLISKKKKLGKLIKMYHHQGNARPSRRAIS